MFGRDDPLLLDLASDEVYPALPVTKQAVRSYHTISPLLKFRLENLSLSGIFSVALSSILIIVIKMSGSYPASFPKKPGLSSANPINLQ